MALVQSVPGRLFKASLEEAHGRASQITAKERHVGAKVRELARVEYLAEAIYAKTESVVTGTVNFAELPDFQRELAFAITNIDELRRALHSIGWAGEKINELGFEYRRKMRGKSNLLEITALRKQFESRAESIIEKVSRDAAIINNAEKALRRMPSLRKMKTVLISGYPNVGKSSILNALSDSKVDVQPYPFTTKSLLVGYMSHGYRRVQIVDTPGILDREARNPIEKQALAAIRHLSDKVMFVIDPSETCGYTLADQEKLLEKVKREFSSDVLVVYNKADLWAHDAGKKAASSGRGLSLSSNDPEAMAALKERLLAWFDDRAKP